MTTPKSTGMLEVGKHCDFCRQIDFLPFYCSYCKGCFCGEHRTKELHHCKYLLKQLENKERQQPKTVDNNGKFFKSLLPEPGYIRVNQPSTGNQATGLSEKNNLTIRGKLEKQGQKTALGKLKSFFEKYSSKSSSGFKIAKKQTPSSKLIAISKMKQTAKGDTKIPQQNRIYCNLYLILGEKDTGKPIKHEFFINKVWPVGRVVDYLASRLDIKNVNISDTATKDEKLFLYIGEDINSKLLNSSDRVLNSVKDGDTLYLVRGLPE
ncbi:hypothetical protein ACO0QE_001125 [Hanseniaspora vineae]